MHQRADIAYVYDGTFDGLLCAIFASYEYREMPAAIEAADAGQMTLYPVKTIPADMEKAARVRRGILNKCGRAVYDLTQNGFYTCADEKELLICRFVHTAMAHGPKTHSMLTDDTVLTLQNAVRALEREVQQYRGFVRFSIHGNVMIAVIEPKNDVLALLAPHFCDRYANESFMIYDKTHGKMLLYQAGRHAILPVEHYEPPQADEEEQNARALWQLFYETIAIADRANPKCRMSHMQKRYWKHLTEMRGRTPFRYKAQKTEAGALLPIGTAGTDTEKN